ncbi:MAG TPA: cytochrome c [Longimicrobiales bacterium]|nr:cytochrome c [Longimicrobiales bacterium]
MIRTLKISLSVVAVLLVGLLAFGGFQLWAYESQAAEIWEVEPPRISVVTDSAVVERGAHVGRAIGACTGCHGEDLAGGIVEDLGPIGVIHAPNLTAGEGGVGGDYTDAELARAIRHGIRRDGTSLRFMPTREHNWWSDEDLAAVVSWVRTFPPVANQVPPTTVRPLGKLLDRAGFLPILSATTVDHEAPPPDIAPGPTAAYGAFLARSCSTCHGETFAGGRIPGAPAELPAPRNLTPHPTGLAGWTQEDFARAMRQGIRPDGTELQDFMPTFTSFTEMEVSALWQYFQSIDALEYGER